MKDSTGSVLSAYVQVGDPLRLRDRIRDGAQRGRLSQGLMGSVLVVEAFVLAQGVPQRALIPSQAAVEQLASAGVHHSFQD